MDRLIFLSYTGTWPVGHQDTGGSEPVLRLCHLRWVLPQPPPAPQLLSGAPCSKKALHLPWLQPCGNELSALSWSRSSLYSQWRETGGGGGLVPLSLSPGALPSSPGSTRSQKRSAALESPLLNACRWVGRKPASASVKSRTRG